MANKYLVMEGDAFNGLTFYGPFETCEEATEFVDLEDLEVWQVCPMLEPDKESGFSLPSETIHGLKKGIMAAIAILDNDQFATRAHNAKAVLQDLIDQYGEPDDC